MCVIQSLFRIYLPLFAIRFSRLEHLLGVFIASPQCEDIANIINIHIICVHLFFSSEMFLLCKNRLLYVENGTGYVCELCRTVAKG